MNEKKPIFDGLTGYRAVAAIMVVFYHSGFSKEVLGSALFSLQKNFNVGVSLFFVLSGFLITFRYSNDQYSFKWFCGYMRNRFARIYPVYGGYCLFVAFVHKGWSAGASIIHGLLLVGLADRDIRFIPHGWSLTVEENFYLCAPILFYFFRKKKFVLPLILSYLIGLSIWLFNIYYPVFDSVFDLGNYFVIWRDTYFGRAFEFIMGAWLALYLLKKPELLKRRESWKC